MRNESFTSRLIASPLALSMALVLGFSGQPSIARPKPAVKPAAKTAPAPDAAKGETDSKSDKSKDAVKDSGKAEQLGSYGDWTAYAAGGGKDKSCYALGQPKDRQPKAKLKDTTAYIFITTRPAENIRNEIAVNLGYPTKDGSAAAAEIDGDAFELITKGQNAWVREQAKEKDFVGALRGGAKLVIKASSAKGTATIDTYSLKGLSDALARVAQECK